MPAWRALPDPMVGALLGRQALRFALAAWRWKEVFQPSQVMRALLLRPLSRRHRALVLTDPQWPHRARLLFPRALRREGKRLRVGLYDVFGDHRHVLTLDQSTESWAYRHPAEGQWNSTPQDSGQLLLVPAVLWRHPSRPLVEPRWPKWRTGGGVSLVLLDGAARSLEAPAAAPWWIVGSAPGTGPEGYLLQLAQGSAFTTLLEVTGAYSFSLLEPGRGVCWRAEASSPWGRDLVRVAREPRHGHFLVRSEVGRRGSLELVLHPDGRASRSLGLRDVHLRPGAALEVWSDDEALSFTIRNHSDGDSVVGLTLEAGWDGDAQRRTFPRFSLGPQEIHTVTPLRWRALGLGPIRHEVIAPGSSRTRVEMLGGGPLSLL